MVTKKPNPFTLRAKRRKSSNRFTARAGGKISNDAKKKSRNASTGTSNPGWNRSSATLPAPSKFDWIEVGMTVRVTWPADPVLADTSYGPREFVGDVIEREEWIKVCNRHKHILYLPLFLSGIEIEQV